MHLSTILRAEDNVFDAQLSFVTSFSTFQSVNQSSPVNSFVFVLSPCHRVPFPFFVKELLFVLFTEMIIALISWEDSQCTVHMHMPTIYVP